MILMMIGSCFTAVIALCDSKRTSIECGDRAATKIGTKSPVRQESYALHGQDGRLGSCLCLRTLSGGWVEK